MIRFLPFVALVVLFVSSATISEQTFQRGLLWEDNRYNLLPVTYAKTVLLPPEKSLKNYYPKVIRESNLDNLGVAWAAAWYARTAAEAIACNQTAPNEVIRFAFAPAYNYALIRKGQDCSEPISVLDLLESMTKNGTPYFSEFREFCSGPIAPENFAIARTKRLSGWLKLFNTSDSKDLKVQSVKQALVNNYAVVVGMVCPPSFQLAKDFWQPREQPDLQYGGHGLCVVGYDDTKFGGAFEVVNSWGKDWGQGGYTWLRYKDFADFVRYGFSFFQVGSAACASPLEGKVTFRLLNGEELKVQNEAVEGEYRLLRSLQTGTSIVISASINRPAYFYSYFVDPNHNVFQAFPMKESTQQPIIFDRIRIPEGFDQLDLAPPAGVNELFFVFSPEKVDPQSLATSHRGASVAFNAGVTWMKDFPGFSSTMKTPVVIKVYLDQK